MQKSLYWLVPVGFFALVMTATALVSALPFDWLNWPPANCLPDGCFCEALQDTETFRQPANTWSSLVFVLVGLLIFGQVAYDISHPSTTNNILINVPIYGIIYGISLLVIGFGSVFYHASLSFIGQFADVAGMYMLTSFMLVYVIQRWAKWSIPVAGIVYFALNIILAILLVIMPETRRFLFGLILVVALTIEGFWVVITRPTINMRWIVIGLALFTLAFGIWVLDNNGILCDPNSLIQGHAAWHILTAIATAYLYTYYRSESVSPSTTT